MRLLRCRSQIRSHDVPRERLDPAEMLQLRDVEPELLAAPTAV